MGDDPATSNIVGCYNLFEAARRKGVKRVVFASSNHAVGFYPRHRRIGTDVTVRPDSRYGVSKAFGEALGALYADKHGLGVLCLRIGHVLDRPADRRRLSIWLKPEDLAQLVRIGLEHPDLRFEIFYGVSLNERSWWDNSRAFAYGYRPTGRAEDYRDAGARRTGQARPRPGRRLLPGRPLLQRRVRRQAGRCLVGWVKRSADPTPFPDLVVLGLAGARPNLHVLRVRTVLQPERDT